MLDDGQNKYSLKLKSGNWRLEESNMYYADSNIVNFLLSNINRSKIGNYTPNENDEFEFVPEWKISIYSASGERTDFAEIKKNTEGLYLAKINGDDKIYEISGYFDFPHDYEMWLPQPLVVIKSEDIYNIDLGEKKFYRNIHTGKFEPKDEKEMESLINILLELGNFDFINAFSSEEIAEKSDVIKLKAELDSGIVYDFVLYRSGDKYFAELKLDTAVAAYKGAHDYVESAQVLYNGWAFEIKPEKYKIFSLE